MRKYFFTLIFCCQVIYVSAQKPLTPLDSLKALLGKTIADDSTKVDLLENIALYQSFSNPDSAINYSAAALTISQKLKYKSGILTSLRQLGAFHINKQDFISAINYLDQALDAGKQYNEADYIASINSNIGMIYLEIEDFPKARDKFLEALPLIAKNKEGYTLPYLLTNLGLTYVKLQDYPLASQYLQNALAFGDTMSLPEVQAACYLNLGIIASQKANYSEALNHYTDAKKYALQGNDVRAQAQAIGGLAEVYFAQKNYKDADELAKQSLALSKQGGFLNSKRDMYRLQIDLYTAQNKLSEAFIAYRNYITVRDSIVSADKRTQLLRFELQQAFDKKEELIRIEALQNQLKAEAETEREATFRKWTTIAAVILIALLIIFIYIYKKRRDAEQLAQQEQLNAEIAQTELKALRAQMNPHFIFNSLNSISQYMHANSLDQTDAYITSFARLMRKTLEHSEERMISLSDELQQLELYMQLEQHRMQNRFIYSIQVDDAVNASDWEMPSLLLQPFVENSIIHGFSAEADRQWQILIKVAVAQNELIFTLEDNGIGRKKSNIQSASKNQHKSMGMNITKNRLALLNRQYQSNARMMISNLDPGTRVQLYLPIIPAF